MTGLEDVPDLVPARMVNEFAYCPRLFYLEWVQSRFADSADTVDGRYQHRVVDEETGLAPAPEEAEDLRSARAVLVSAPSLGLIGKIDLLEGDGGAVVPVDYKRGSPADRPERALEPERRQVAVQALMLRDAGYQVEHGEIYFVETRKRVRIDLTAELVNDTRRSVEALRAVAGAGTAPEPLVDSPKCPRCSLVGICLPDEHNLLKARSSGPPRRLTPSADEARPVYITEAGASVTVRGGRLEVMGRPPRESADRPEKRASLRLIDVSQLVLFGNVQVSTQALRELFCRDTPVLYFSGGGWLEGVAQGLPSKHVVLRVRQVALASQGGLEAARAMVRGKIKNCRVLLRRNAKTDATAVVSALGRLATSIDGIESAASLLGVEGAAARSYFGAFPAMLRVRVDAGGEPFSFEGRNRRPPRDPVNCLLSFVYALLVKDLVAVCIGVGLDPYIGVFHRPRFGRPALALDLAEEFRPIVGDSIVVNLINNGEIQSSDFIVRAQGVALTTGGRKAVIAAYERRLDIEVTHPVFGYRITYRRVLEVQARILAAWMLGEVPEYTPFSTR